MSERQKQLMLKMFSDNGNVLTTGDFLSCELSAEYRKIISLLRKDGYNIPKPKLNRDKPSLNKYILFPPTEATSWTPPISKKGWKQHYDKICPNCQGSYYTNNGICTKCEKLRS